MDKAIELARKCGAGEPESLFGRTDYVVLTKDELERFYTLARADLVAEVEQLRVQLAGCGVAAMQNTVSSRPLRVVRGNYGYSESYADVCRAVDREIELREENAKLNSALEDILFHVEDAMGNEVQPYEIEMAAKRARAALGENK